MDRCKADTKSQSIVHFSRILPQESSIRKEDKEEIKKLLANFVTSANLPFRVVDNSELIALTQFCTQLGAKYSNFDINSIWYSRVTIRDHVVKICNERKNLIITQMENATAERTLSISTDIWTDNVNRDSFIDVSIHWIENYSHMNACIAFK